MTCCPFSCRSVLVRTVYGVLVIRIHSRGAAGVRGRRILLALAQAHASPCVLECDIDDVILYLVNEVKQNTFGGNPTLCHGDVGNLWLLEHVGELIADDDLKNESVSAGHQWMASVFPSYIRSLSRSSVSHGLFVGIGGACMYAEHLLSPTTTVRSPLWLE